MPHINQIFPQLEDEGENSPRQRTVSEPNVASEGSGNEQQQGSSPKARSEKSQSNSDMKR